MQLQLDGGFVTTEAMQRPVPVIPPSQDVQPEGQALHVGPKYPVAHDSQEVPLNPVGHVQVPEAEQTPFPEQGGEHAVDCKFKREREPEAAWGS